VSKYKENYEKIFGSSKVQRGSWVQDPITCKLIPKVDYQPPDTGKNIYVHGDLESFVSPITQEVISDRRQLREHMLEHGVTNSQDYSQEYMLRKSHERVNSMLGQTPQAKKERVETIRQELEKRGF